MYFYKATLEKKVDNTNRKFISNIAFKSLFVFNKYFRRLSDYPYVDYFTIRRIKNV